MRRSKFVTLASALVLTGLASAFAVRTQTAEEPTPAHEALTGGAGMYKGMMTIHDPVNGDIPMPATENVVAIGDFWTTSEFRCAMGPGMEYIGFGQMGYDPKAGEMIGTWIDNQSSFLAQMRGTYDAESNTTTMNWEAPVAEQGGNMVKHKLESTMNDEGYVMHMYIDMDGEFYNFMSVDMKRQKDGAKAEGETVEAGSRKDG